MELPAIRKLNVGKRKSGFGSSRHKNSNLSSCYLAPLSTRDNLDLASSSVPNKENGPLLPAVHTRGRLGSLITTVGNGPPFPARVIQQTRCDIEERPVLTLTPLDRFKKLARTVGTILRMRKAFRSDPKRDLGKGIAKSFLELMERYMMIKNQLYIQESSTDSDTAPLLFNPTSFQANTEVKISKEVEKILGLKSEQRTPDQLNTVLYALQTLVSFSELPLRMQQAICKVAWLQNLPPNKIIIKQGHFAENFYLIVSGSVTVLSEKEPTKDSVFTSLATLRKGASFGDVALLNNCRRTATVVSKDSVQLLVICKEDYQNIFMGKSKSGEEPPHITFCRTLPFVSSWPVEYLIGNTMNCRLQYFRRGSVVVKDSNASEWIYIVKAGVCEVLVELEINKPKLQGKYNANRRAISALDKIEALSEARYRKSRYSQQSVKQSWRDMECTAVRQSSVISREVTSVTRDSTCSLPLITSAYSDGHHRTRRAVPIFPHCRTNYKRMRTIPPVAPSSCNTERLDFNHAKKETTFVQIDTLHPRNVFGLTTLNFGKHEIDFGEPASVSLVSRGAECVMISKKLFVANADERTKKWIRQNVCPYPTKAVLQENLQQQINWNAYKQDLLQDIASSR